MSHVEQKDGFGSGCHPTPQAWGACIAGKPQLSQWIQVVLPQHKGARQEGPAQPCPGMRELPSSGAQGSRPCWTQGFISTCCLPSWVREDVWGLSGGDPQKLECPGGFRNNQARTGICPFVWQMVAAERSWSLEMGLGGSCWCHDGPSCTRRVRGELNVG